jgi:hypothetical protein
VPFGGLIVIDVVLLAAPATSAGNHLSVGLENLFNLNRISHNWEQYNTATEKRKHKNHFFYFFSAQVGMARAIVRSHKSLIIKDLRARGARRRKSLVFKHLRTGCVST